MAECPNLPEEIRKNVSYDILAASAQVYVGSDQLPEFEGPSLNKLNNIRRQTAKIILGQLYRAKGAKLTQPYC